MITAFTTGGTIFPVSLTAGGTWNHMVNGQLVVIKCIHAVLTSKQVAHVQVVTAKLNILLIMKVVFGYTYTGYIYCQSFTVYYPIGVRFNHMNPAQIHQFDGSLPVNNTQWQN